MIEELHCKRVLLESLKNPAVPVFLSLGSESLFLYATCLLRTQPFFYSFLLFIDVIKSSLALGECRMWSPDPVLDRASCSQDTRWFSYIPRYDLATAAGLLLWSSSFAN